MRFLAAALVVVVTALVAAPASAAKLVVFAPTAGPGLGAKEASVIGDAVAAAASRAGHDVVTQQQLESLVGLEAAKQMAGCDAGSCAGELGGALGVDAVVNVSVGKLGQSLVVTVKRIDVRGGGGKVADARIQKKKGAIDAALDALPALVGEALAGLPTTTPTTTAPATTTTTAPTLQAPATTTTTPLLTPARKETKLETPPPKLAWAKDAAGRFVAWSVDEPTKGPVFFGSGGRFFQLRDGEGSSMNGKSWSKLFWDPRFRDGAERSVDHKDGVVTITCGAKTTTFQPTQAPTSATFYAPPFQRIVVLLGRDDALRYVVVDALREEPRDGPLKDLRVFLGKKQKLQLLDVEVEEDAAFGDGGVIAVGNGVTLKLGPEGGSLVEGAAPNATTSKLSEIDLFNGAKTVYGELKPWGDIALGTPCDP